MSDVSFSPNLNGCKCKRFSCTFACPRVTEAVQSMPVLQWSHWFADARLPLPNQQVAQVRRCVSPGRVLRRHAASRPPPVPQRRPACRTVYQPAAEMLQSLAQRHRAACCFTLLTLGYALYLAFGAVVFSSVELPREDALRQELRAAKAQFLRDNDCVSEETLDAFLDAVLEASSYGVSVLYNATENWNWDFTSALFFASTVLSTTGYGHTVPLSDGGKAFCMAYSVVGIPFTLLFLTAVVQRVMVFSTRRPVSWVQQRWGYPRSTVAAVHAVVLGALAILCFFIIPAAIFSVLEDNWNFLESFYFCFISLSTIGLGDYVPGEGYNQKFRQLYKLGITLYLVLGLIVMLVVLETFCELKQLKELRKMFYPPREKPEDQLEILDHDHLSFCATSDHADVPKPQRSSDGTGLSADVMLTP